MGCHERGLDVLDSAPLLSNDLVSAALYFGGCFRGLAFMAVADASSSDAVLAGVRGTHPDGPRNPRHAASEPRRRRLEVRRHRAGRRAIAGGGQAATALTQRRCPAVHSRGAAIDMGPPVADPAVERSDQSPSRNLREPGRTQWIPL